MRTATREVAVASCAKAVKSVKHAMLRQPAMTRCARARPLLTLSGRRCLTASANKATGASSDVLTRMLNGGISLSAIFMAGQLSPQARLTATSMRRAVGSAASWVEAGDTLSVPAGQEKRRGGTGLAPPPCARARLVGWQKYRPRCGPFVMLHRSWRYVTQPRDLAGFGSAPAFFRGNAEFH